MLAQLEVQVVGKQNVKLDAQQTALCQQAAPLLDEGTETVDEVGIGNDHRFAEQGALLGAANVEHIAQTGDVGQGQVTAVGSQCVTQTGAVQEQGQLVLFAHGGDGFQLGLGIECAGLGGLVI